MVSTAVSADFHSTFQNLKSEINYLISSSGSTAQITPLVTNLRNLLNQSIGSLPAYDQRQYDLQLKELETQLGALRGKEKPRSKFAFSARAKTEAKPSSTLDNTTSTGPSTPVGIENALGTSKPGASLSTANAASSSTSSSLSSSTYTISGRSHQRITAAEVERGILCQQHEYTLSLSDLSECIIDLRPASSNASATISESGSGGPSLKSLHGRGLTRCVLIAGVLGGSAMLRDMTDCLVIIGAHQFRMHTSTRCDVYLHVTSVPVIEHSKDLGFAPYPSFLLSSPATSPNRVADLADFDWVRNGPSPNWHAINTEDQLDEGQFGTIQSDIGIAEVLDKILPRHSLGEVDSQHV